MTIETYKMSKYSYIGYWRQPIWIYCTSDRI